METARNDFPILHQEVYGKPLVYLDSATTTQKPVQVIEAISRFYSEDYANVHRGVHALSERATRRFEGVREKLRHFINADDSRQIVFVRGATEGINLVASTFGASRVGAGDAVLITGMEHHSNIVPWQRLCRQQGARLEVAPITDRGEVNLEAFELALTDKVKVVALAHVSNALGTINPVEAMVQLAHARGIPVLLDGAQAMAHIKVDVRRLDCDFYVFSSHKMYGPDGVGVLYGRPEHLEGMPPYQSGGDMIKSVTFERTIYNDVPYKFEAGTPNIAGAVGLGAAVDYLEALGLEVINQHESRLLEYATRRLAKVPGIRFIGTAPKKAAVISFVLEGIHPHDIGTIVDREGVGIRAGHHCAQPVMERFGVPATARASFGLYNTRDDVDALVRALEKVREVFN